MQDEVDMEFGCPVYLCLPDIHGTAALITFETNINIQICIWVRGESRYAQSMCIKKCLQYQDLADSEQFGGTILDCLAAQLDFLEPQHRIGTAMANASGWNLHHVPKRR